MLSATIGSLDDVVVGKFDSAPEVVSPVFSGEALGLPSGVSLLVCPVANWSEGDSGQLAPTSAIETDDSFEAFGSFFWVIDDSGVLLCTAFPPATFSLSGDADFGDSTAPPVVDPSFDGGQDTVVDPIIIVDPVITDPPTFDPVDVRGQFVSSDPGWAAYDDRGGPDGSEENGAGGIQLQVITASADLPWIEFGTPGEALAFDAWYERSLQSVTLRNADGVDPIPQDVTDPVLYVCDGYPLPREFCILPMPDDSTSVDGAELADSGLSVDVRAYSTVTGTQSPVPVTSTNTVPFSWMAAFAANVPGTGGDSTQPAAARRRGR